MCREVPADPVLRFLMELSKNLRLEFHEQDWGFINADAQRLEEFISYFFHPVPEVDPHFQDTFVWHMTELILESAALYFAGGTRRPEIDAEIGRFWKSIQGHEAADWYWQDVRRQASGVDGFPELLSLLEEL